MLVLLLMMMVMLFFLLSLQLCEKLAILQTGNSVNTTVCLLLLTVHSEIYVISLSCCCLSCQCICLWRSQFYLITINVAGFIVDIV